MKMPLKKASWVEKVLHGGSVVAVIGALIPLLQTMWTEKPWWVEDAPPPAPVEVVEPVEFPDGELAMGPVEQFPAEVELTPEQIRQLERLEPAAGAPVAPEPTSSWAISAWLGGLALVMTLAGALITSRRWRREKEETAAIKRSELT